MINAQRNMGSSLGNFAGTQALNVNPAYLHTGNLFWTANIGGAGFDFHQNYAHVEQANLFSARRLLLESVADSESGEISFLDAFSNKGLRFDTFKRQSKVSAIAEIAGPGFWIRSGEFGFGFMTRQRMSIHMKNLPYKSEIDFWESEPEGTDFTLERMSLSGFTWSEFAVNTSFSFENYFSIPIVIGLNVKYLQPQDGLYLANNSATTSAKYNDSLYVDVGDFQLAYFSGL